MSQVYKILRVISTSKKGSQITCAFNGKVVTRHIKGGFGKHPDEDMPVKHIKALRLKDLLIEEVSRTEKEILEIEALLANPEADRKEQSRRARFLTPMRAFLLAAPQEIKAAEDRILSLESDDPLIVKYIQEAK